MLACERVGSLSETQPKVSFPAIMRARLFSVYTIIIFLYSPVRNTSVYPDVESFKYSGK